MTELLRARGIRNSFRSYNVNIGGGLGGDYTSPNRPSTPPPRALQPELGNA